MTKQEEKLLSRKIENSLKDAHFQGLKAGAKGILGTVLDMCNKGKSVEDIKKFCETSLNLKGMQ